MRRMKGFYRSVLGSFGFVALGALPAAHGFEWRLDADTTFSAYGSIELFYLNERVETAAGDTAGLLRLRDRDTTFGLAGRHRFGNALVVFFRSEFETEAGVLAGAGDRSDTDFGDIDQAYVGVKGPWGALQAGVWDGVYEDRVADVTDVFEYDGATKFEDYRTGELGDSVAYMSPSYGGFSFAIQGFFDGGSHAANDEAFQLAAGYQSERYAIQLGYDDNGFDANSEGTFGVSGSIDLSPVSLAVKYEYVGNSRGDPSNPNDTSGAISAYTLTSAYDYGPGSVIALVQQVEPDRQDDRTEFGLHVNYSLAENFYVYGEHMGYDNHRDLGNYTGVGLVYEF